MTRDWLAVCVFLGWADGSQDGTAGSMLAPWSPKVGQGGHRMAPRCETLGPRGPKIVPRWAQDAAQWVPSWSKIEPRGASRPPVDAKMRPRWSPKLVKMTQKTPKVIIMAVVLERVMWIGGDI